LREGGRWTLAQTLKNHLLLATIRFALFAVRPWPTRALRWAGRALGAIAFRLLRYERGVALANLTRVYPALTERERRALARRCFVQLGDQLGEAVSMLSPRRPLDPMPFAPGSLETLQNAITEGRGVLFASAHLGPWERVAASIAAAGFPLVTVAREAYDPRLTALYDRLRAQRGVRFVYRGAAGAGARMLRVLRTGGLLGMPMDLRTRAPSVQVPFLGAEAPTPIGPARLALRTRAAVVVGTASKSSEGAPEILVTRVSVEDLAPGAEAELTRRINEELSRRILAFPEAWVWMHGRW
jgi:KDO2-lipid IV(A) lauroyltransferase